MKIRFSLLVLTGMLAGSIICPARPPRPKTPELAIQYISLEKSWLGSFLTDYIRAKEAQYALFKQGYGYVSLQGIRTLNYAKAPLDLGSSNADVSGFGNTRIADFSASLESHPFVLNFKSDCWLCSDYPTYFTYVDNRLVLIYDDVLGDVLAPYHAATFTRKSKKRLIQAVRPFLKASLREDFVFYVPLRPDHKTYILSTQQRRGLSEHELFKQADWTAETALERYTLHRNGAISPLAD